MAERRVVSRLLGGTGNQLFQYAAGRALADHLGCDLLLDARHLSARTARGDCFAHFARARFARDDAALPPARHDGLLRYVLWRIFGRTPRFHREKGLGFDRGFFDLPPETYLHGYWQSQRYFAPIADRLRRDLAFTTPLAGANAAMAQTISKAPSPVAVHVRRGDYTASGAYAACSPGYYRNAVDTIRDRLDRPLTCFVFSNDPDWARANLDLGQETIVVDINDETGGHFDLHLQSLCAHNVIANSSFSWWAAWLNANPDRIVVAPKNWFAPGKPDNPDICPADWIRL
ncbi:alpha-1,2-fucosyltransferase [Roseovarius sp. TE539]|uniref:alpha-1,2-fucosyltransferase n=1 Tax=Roseovarius sp. TE539 TaxID=2249812 RepID=UPI000DE10F33|nr:alpha-1,2-fucosyltransferase [Roseovarius sp. TE539]RBI71568.1 alpha-1,2-fucosyltransferase [Roseovarius sp. TE539]